MMMRLLLLFALAFNAASHTVHRLRETSESELVIDAQEDVNSGCSCTGYDCGCCVQLNINEGIIHINEDICVNVTYLPKKIGLEFTVTLNGKVLIHEVISARDPPPICVGIPHFEDYASICVEFYDLDFKSSEVDACLKLEARLIKERVWDHDFGCFSIPLEDVVNRGMAEEPSEDHSDVIHFRP